MSRNLIADRHPDFGHRLGALGGNDLSRSSESLRACLEGGVAFHTSNLTHAERVVVEKHFRDRDGGIVALAATTLRQLEQNFGVERAKMLIQRLGNMAAAA